jgi:hypothetical protein
MQQDLFTSGVAEATTARRTRRTVSPRPTSPATYRRALFSGVPLYTTRLVRERVFTFPEREQVSSPAAAAAVLQDYFADRDREEFVVCLLDTVMRD